MTDDPTGSCPTCGRRDPTEPLLCEPCRSRLRFWLSELPDLHEQLLTEEPVGIAGQSAGGRVSGSKERRLPIRVDPIDLTGPARTVSARAALDEDAVGHTAVATLLDFWVEDWRTDRAAGEGRPDPDTRVLAGWLLDRLDDACDHSAPIDEFFDQIRRAHGALRAELGLVDVPDYKRGIPCPECEGLTLVKPNGSAYVECGTVNCDVLLDEADYARHLSTMAAAVKQQRKEAAPETRRCLRL